MRTKFRELKMGTGEHTAGITPSYDPQPTDILEKKTEKHACSSTVQGMRSILILSREQPFVEGKAGVQTQTQLLPFLP